MRLDDVLSAVRPVSDERPGSVVVIGGGQVGARYCGVLGTRRSTAERVYDL